MKTPLILRYFLWSMVIFAVSMFCLSFRSLDSLRYRALAIGPGLLRGSYSKTFKETELPFRVVALYGPQMSQERYLDVARQVVHHLKFAGARVVIVPIPDFFQPSPQAHKAVREIAADSIAVFGVFASFNSRSPWERSEKIEDKGAWWVRHPFFNRLNVPWGVLSPATSEGNPLIRFVPVGFRETETGAPVPDVAMVALKQYFGVPGNEELPLSRSRVSVGPLNVQLGQDGVSYVRFAFNQRRISEISAACNYATDSVDYFPAWDPDTRTTIAEDRAWRNHKGTIVMIDWDGARRFQYLYYGFVYQQIFGSAFTGSFLTVHNEWNVLLITTLVVLLSVVSYTFRNSLTVLLSFMLSAATLVISNWLFTSYDVIFEPVYIVLPIVLCGLILPAVKLSGEKRIAEEMVKSLSEENRRLLDLQRSASPPAAP